MEDSIDHISKKCKFAQNKAEKDISKLINIKEQCDNNKFNTIKIALFNKIRELAGMLTNLQKQLGEDVMNNKNMSLLSEFFEGSSEHLNHLIFAHFVACGRLDIARSLNEEFDLCIPCDYSLIQSILDSLENHDSKPLINWMMSLNDIQFPVSHIHDLLFMCYATQFITLYSDYPLKSIEELRSNMNQLFSLAPMHQYVPRLQKLISNAILHSKSGEYSWSIIIDDYLSLSSRTMIQPPQSALETVLNASIFAIPAINVQSFSIDDLLIDIPAYHQFHFHSTLVCPITREVANKCVLLPCGHVLSLIAMEGLCSISNTLKCPTCPMISKPSEIVDVHFN